MRLKDVKKGDRFYETDYGISILVEALESAREVHDDESQRYGHECLVLLLSGVAPMFGADGTMTMFESHEPGGYGLDLTPA